MKLIVSLFNLCVKLKHNRSSILYSFKEDKQINTATWEPDSHQYPICSCKADKLSGTRHRLFPVSWPCDHGNMLNYVWNVFALPIYF